MAIEAPILLFVAHYKQRPWSQQPLTLTPAIAFVWTWNAALQARDAYYYWLSYLRFQADRYPAAFAPAFARDTPPEIHTSVATVTRQGWMSVALMAGMLALGWALLLRWRLPRTGQPTTDAITPAIVHSEEDEAGTLEITVEPIDPH